MVNIDETEAMLDEIARELPHDFFKELNGGVMLLPEQKINHDGLAGDLLIMGEYVHDRAPGRYIAIYFGSFEAVYGNLPPNAFRSQLKKVLIHEFTHHLESLAGDRSLERKDERELERFRKNARKRKNDS